MFIPSRSFFLPSLFWGREWQKTCYCTNVRRFSFSLCMKVVATNCPCLSSTFSVSFLSLSLSLWRRISCVLSVCDGIPRQRTASDVTSVAFHWWYLSYDSLWCASASGLHTCSQFLSYTLLSSSHSGISRGHTTVLLYPLRASLSSSACHWIPLIFYSICFLIFNVPQDKESELYFQTSNIHWGTKRKNPKYAVHRITFQSKVNLIQSTQSWLTP